MGDHDPGIVVVEDGAVLFVALRIRRDFAEFDVVGLNSRDEEFQAIFIA
jgi:hypothetical protein